MTHEKQLEIVYTQMYYPAQGTSSLFGVVQQWLNGIQWLHGESHN